MLYLLILACEAAFWVALVLALLLRYRFGRLDWSRWLLLSLPVLDAVLLLFAALDLQAGTPATPAHGLAAVYVGFTITFGPLAVRWADAQAAHRLAGGPAPPKAPSAGWQALRYELGLWLRCIGAWVIALTLIALVIGWLGDNEATQPLHLWFRLALGCVFFWFIFGPVWSLLFFRRGVPTAARDN